MPAWSLTQLTKELLGNTGGGLGICRKAGNIIGWSSLQDKLVALLYYQVDMYSLILSAFILQERICISQQLLSTLQIVLLGKLLYSQTTQHLCE